MIKLLTADGHPVVSEGLKHFFDGDAVIRIVRQVKNSDDLFRQLKKHSIDIILMDTCLDTEDGIRCARLIRRRHPDVNVVFFSHDKDPASIRRANYAGAAGYIIKSASKSLIRQSILKVAAGEKVLDPAIDPLQIVVKRKRAKTKTPFIGAQQFSPREKQVLGFLSEGLTNQEISGRLGVSRSTVETFRARIMAKSKKKNVAELVKWAVSSGLLN